jgi:hypothetical protein
MAARIKGGCFPLLPAAPCGALPCARLAPPHTHYLRAATMTSEGHRHWLETFVYAANGNAYDGHVHDYQGVTGRTSGHTHRFYGRTGPALPLPGGSHCHTVSGLVYSNYTKPPLVLHGEKPLEGGVFYGDTIEGLHRHAYSAVTGANFGEPPPDW